MNNDRVFYLTNEKGEEVQAEIIFTTHSDEFNRDYVVYQVLGIDEAYAARYVQTSDTSGSLEPIDSDEEWEYIEQLLNDFYEEQEDEDGE